MAASIWAGTRGDASPPYSICAKCQLTKLRWWPGRGGLPPRLRSCEFVICLLVACTGPFSRSVMTPAMKRARNTVPAAALTSNAYSPRARRRASPTSLVGFRHRAATLNTVGDACQRSAATTRSIQQSPWLTARQCVSLCSVTLAVSRPQYPHLHIGRTRHASLVASRPACEHDNERADLSVVPPLSSTLSFVLHAAPPLSHLPPPLDTRNHRTPFAMRAVTFLALLALSSAKDECGPNGPAKGPLPDLIQFAGWSRVLNCSRSNLAHDVSIKNLNAAAGGTLTVISGYGKMCGVATDQPASPSGNNYYSGEWRAPNTRCAHTRANLRILCSAHFPRYTVGTVQNSNAVRVQGSPYDLVV